MHQRILLIEDSVNDAELTLLALERLNVADIVDVCRDGADGLDYLYRRGAFADRISEAPLLILLDLKMPRIDGLEVLRAIKSDATLKIIPIVVLTSSQEEQDVLRSYHCGANAYVVKPVESGEFLHALQGLGIFWITLNQRPPL